MLVLLVVHVLSLYFVVVLVVAEIIVAVAAAIIAIDSLNAVSGLLC